MRFVLVGPTYPYRGGIAHYTTMLARVLREKGHQLLLISFKRQYPRRLFPGHSDKDPSTDPLEVEGVQYWLDSLNPATWLKTFDCIRKYAPDAIILQWWTPFWTPVWCVLGILNRLLLRSPLIYICHNVLPHETHWWSPWLARLALHWGTSFIVQSSDEAAVLLDLIRGPEVDIVPHPVYDIFGRQRVSKEDARRQLGVPIDVPVLLFFGIVRAYKGLEDLLKALPKVRAQLGETMLLVAGEFWEDKQSYLDLIDELGVTESVVIEDRYVPNERVSLYMSAADVLVAPYRRVTGSAVVQAARGSGCPVITTDLEGLRQTMEPFNSGLLAQPGNSQSLAETIGRFFLEPRAQRSRSGYSTDGQRSWDQLVAAIEKASAECT
jgi:glycosyltransferase involved in cell wall biosynthesis